VAQETEAAQARKKKKMQIKKPPGIWAARACYGRHDENGFTNIDTVQKEPHPSFANRT